MLANSQWLSRISLPQTSAGWEQVIARCIAIFAQVPLSAWQQLVRFFLVLCLSLSLAHLFWLVLPVPNIPPASATTTISGSPVISDNPSAKANQLKPLTLFGTVDAPPAVEPSGAAPAASTAPIENQAVDTTLNLVLVGIVNGSEEVSSRAIIASGEAQSVYSVNDPLPIGNNVSLAKVLADKVILNNNGQYESLWMYKNDAATPPLVQALTAPPASSLMPTAARQDSESQASQVVAQVSHTLADVLAMSVYREGGQVIGYKIRPGRDAEKFKSLGLQTDDIVTAINGTPLTNPGKIMDLYKSMGSTTSASLEIRRSGNLMTVDVVLQ